MIDSSNMELTVWTNKGPISLDFGDLAYEVMFKSIGLEVNADGSYTYFGNKTLGDILQGNINPFKLKKIKE